MTDKKTLLKQLETMLLTYQSMLQAFKLAQYEKEDQIKRLASDIEKLKAEIEKEDTKSSESDNSHAN